MMNRSTAVEMKSHGGSSGGKCRHEGALDTQIANRGSQCLFRGDVRPLGFYTHTQPVLCEFVDVLAAAQVADRS